MFLVETFSMGYRDTIAMPYARRKRLINEKHLLEKKRESKKEAAAKSRGSRR